MARLSYSAPGVYVEEIPSARQPIAGVGTNTAGFIGVVHDTIYIPETYPDYDPVLAKAMAEVRRLGKAVQPGPALDTLKDELLRANQRLEELTKVELPKLTEAAAKSTTDREEAEAPFTKAEADLRAASIAQVPADITAARQARSAAEVKLADARAAEKKATDQLALATTESERLPTEIGRANDVIALKAADKAPDDENYDSKVKDDDPSLKPSVYCPYYLVPFTVRAEEFGTKLCTNFSEYTALFGDYSAFKSLPQNPGDPPSQWIFDPIHLGHHLLTHAVDGFFKNGGTKCFVARVKPENLAHWEKVLERFKSIEEVAILAAPGVPKDSDHWDALQTYCEDDAHQNVFAILDSPSVVGDSKPNEVVDVRSLKLGGEAMPRKSAHAAYYFPHIEVSDPAKRLQDSDPAREIAPKYRGLTHVAPSGHVAGIYARTDEERGVHKAPANATVRGALEVKYYVSKPVQELLNPQGVNCIRLMNGDVTVWGARNVGGDSLGEWKYINVRRFAGFLEASITNGTSWIVFEPNDQRLWGRIILNITAFLTNVWRSGALFGLTPQEAFYVKCDAELNPEEVRDLGQVITEIGVAIVRPAEFVIFRITQSTGSAQG
jgi:uncharacterized protein